MGIDERLAELRIELPPPPAVAGSYVPALVSEDLVYVSGQVPLIEGQVLHPGKVGGDVSLEEAQEAAHRCALQALSVLRNELGSLDRIVRIVQVTIYVASAPGFTDQPRVANAASELFVDVLGEAGRHTRAAVGVAELPLGVAVELALVARVSDAPFA
ncbi:MAG: RidA family protein [Actinomycetota bacterium]